MKIVVSGGWGYGNVGDDAILLATKELVSRHLPAADVFWFSYDPALTRDVGINSSVSVHRLMDGTRAFGFMQTIGRCVPAALWPRLPRRVYERVLKNKVECLCAAADKLKWVSGRKEPEVAFQDADLFIMSGGGYFNKWESMFRARVRELELAHKYGCKVILIGQSIGPFTDKQKLVLGQTLKPTDVIYVRDSDSVDELAAFGIKAVLVPDLAMGFPNDVAKDKTTVVVVPAELNREQERVLAEQLAGFAKKRSVRLVLTLTRLIYPDVATLRNLKCLLKKHGVNVELHMPNTYSEMLADIEKAGLIVSRGLHAMILGWRGGSKIFALTESRKVNGFLAAISAETCQCAEDSWEFLAGALEKCENVSCGVDMRYQVAKAVDEAFKAALKEVGL